MKRSFFIFVILLAISTSLLACNFATIKDAILPGEKTTEIPDETEIKTDNPTEMPIATEIATEVPESTDALVLGVGSTQVSPKDGMIMVYVPAGEFIMGSAEGVGNANEHPQNTQTVDAFWIDQTEVSNAMFTLFVNETNYTTDAEIIAKSYTFYEEKWQLVDEADWAHPFGPSSDISGYKNYPVTHVSWKDALAYCEWAGRALPTEAQWEKAARGTSGETYPWGNAAPSGDLVNYADSSLNFYTADPNVNDGYEFTSPVGSFPNGKSEYGVLDIAGNVWEWVSSLAQPYPYNAADGRENLIPVGKRLIRGGSWFDTPVSLQTTNRYEFDQNYTGLNTGFRCALPIE
jgi:eukaryotic-like serine/threonine-protein kinase